MVAISIVYMCFVEFYSFPGDIDPHNMESGLKNAYTLLGAILGMVVVYAVDEKWLQFPTEAVWLAQIIKLSFRSSGSFSSPCVRTPRMILASHAKRKCITL
jgi:hypothetical protein